jgi:regulatory protein
MSDDPLYEKAKQKALRLLLYRGRSTGELRFKLRERGFDEKVIRKVIDRFLELKYLDDETFSREWARSLAVNKLWGNRRIELSLRDKGIERELIERAVTFAREEIDESEAIRKLVEKRLRRKSISEIANYKEKRRLAQNLLGRGFPPRLIFDELGKLQEDYIDNG